MNVDDLGFPKPEFDELPVCDGCATRIEPSEYGASYFCDTIWMQLSEHNLPTISPQDLYCLNCYPDGIPMPHSGTNEGIVLVEVERYNEGYSYERQKVVKGSSQNQGVEWGPAEVIDSYHPTPVSELGFPITPMYAYIMYRRSGIDLESFVTDGALRIPDDIEDSLTELLRISLRRGDNKSLVPEEL